MAFVTLYLHYVISLRFRSLLVASVGLVVAACSGDASPSTTITAPTTTVAPATTTSTTTSVPPTTTSTTLTPTTTTTVPDDGIPYPDNRSNDWLLVMTELMRFAEWLDENPDPEFVAVIFVPDTSMYERAQNRIEDWASRGIRAAPGSSREAVSVDEDLYSELTGTVILNVVDQYSEAVLIDEDGSVVEVEPELPPALSRVTLYWDQDHGWRIAEWNVSQEFAG